MSNVNVIDSFTGPYRFLSNFHYSPIDFKGWHFKTVEHAYQAAKTSDVKKSMRIATCSSAFLAKKMSKDVELRENWNEIKDKVMYTYVKLKFEQNKHLKEALFTTADAILIEGNYWHDYYWGFCNGKGQNKLGVILMRVREELRRTDTK